MIIFFRIGVREKKIKPQCPKHGSTTIGKYTKGWYSCPAQIHSLSELADTGI